MVWTCTEERSSGYICRRMQRMELPGKTKRRRPKFKRRTHVQGRGEGGHGSG